MNTFRKIEQPLAPWFAHQTGDFGLPASKVADKLDQIENLYVVWRNSFPRWWRRIVLFIASSPLRLFREQTKLLVTELTAQIANQVAAAQQNESASRAIRNIEQSAELRAFLMDHFPAELAQADAANTPLHKVCMRIMLEQ